MARYRSWSQLTQFEQCSWQYKLKRRDRFQEAPAVWLAGGNAYHAATEQFDLYACEHGLDAAVEAGGWGVTFLAEFESELDKLRAAEPDEDKWRTASSQLVLYKRTGETATFWRDRGVQWTQKYLDWRLANRALYDIMRLPNGDPLLELELRVLVGGVPVIAKGDLALTDLNTGATIAVDRKSGKNMPDELDQLGLYGKTMEQAGVGTIWYGAFFDARKGRLTEPKPLDRYRNTQTLEGRFRRMDAEEKAGDYRPNLTFMCKWCGVKDHCQPFKESNIE